jgi:hypothetical protein
MDSSATKKAGSKKPARVYSPVSTLPPKKPAKERAGLRGVNATQRLTRQALKELQARLIRCSPWLADPKKP